MSDPNEAGTTVSSVPSMSPMSIVSGMLGMPYSFHNGVKSTVGTSVVLDNASSTVSFLQSVPSIDFLSMGMFVLRLLITSVRILNPVLELVVRRTLIQTF